MKNSTVATLAYIGGICLAAGIIGLAFDDWRAPVIVVGLSTLAVLGHVVMLRLGKFMLVVVIGAESLTAQPMQTVQVPVVGDDGAQSPVIGALCVGFVIGVAGWGFLKVWEKCSDIQIRRNTNAIHELNLAPASVETSIKPSGSQYGSSECDCGAMSAEAVSMPVPIDLQYWTGERWESTTPRGMVPGRDVTVPLTAPLRARIIPITVERGMFNPPAGTVQSSDDLVSWVDDFTSDGRLFFSPVETSFWRMKP